MAGRDKDLVGRRTIMVFRKETQMWAALQRDSHRSRTQANLFNFKT